MLYRYFITCCCLLWLCVPAHAGESPKGPNTRTILLSGKITDTRSNELLAGVKIITTKSQQAFYSDLEGHFCIALEVAGDQNIDLSFSQVGYHLKNITLQQVLTTSGDLTISLKSE